MIGPRLDDFVPGTAYDVRAANNVYPLTLDKALALPESGRANGSFRLEFVGPGEPVLPQAIYCFANGDTERDIFIVPIARDAGGTRYEAIFY